MYSTILELLYENDWDIDDLLSGKNYRYLAISELSRFEGYVEGLTELNNMLTKQLERRDE